jgi:hypothetical protein
MMNERIKELASKHALYVDGGNGKTNYTFTKESLDVFIDSLVNECNIALNPLVQNRNVISRGQAYELIKQHLSTPTENK